jgi:uncharacterized membrane protein YiaA
MNAETFYLGALVLFVISAILIQKTDPFSSCGCSEYEGRRTRRLAAIILLIFAIFSLTIGVVTQYPFG